MDVKREGVAKKKLIRRILLGVLVVAAVPVITVGLNRLKPAAPSVEASTIWPDTVKRGPMERKVPGLGTLVPEEILWIPAQFAARVDKINLRAGAQVSPETVLVVLSNPDMELSATDYDWQVKEAEAKYTDLKVKMQSAEIEQQSTVSRSESEYTQAKLTKERDEELAKLGLKPDLDMRLSVAKYQDAVKKFENEKKKLEIMRESSDAQLAAQKVQIEKLRATQALKDKQFKQLVIRAGTTGVLQEMNLQVGQQVTPGQVLAKVAQPWKLKAELKIAETQAKDLLLGQAAKIDTRNGVIDGRVSRIDPASVNGTVTVDVRLEGALPSGARPDLSVDGTILIERLNDVVYCGRPVFGQPNSTVQLFKIDADGKGASKVRVKFGRSSVNTIEVVEGLNVGDRVILSDMSQWDAHDRIRLN
ncbi:MAG: HlyD family efflux transporter periplasmic adaptor subunit [Acidobacteria bacterium]|nr:HlyD family efflux transporter periplasmic adaptor subunit [Acidobacteriota bacterium]